MLPTLWLETSGDPKLAWLMDRARATGLVMPAGDGKFDASDAGMVFWLVTGRGDQTVTEAEIKALLTAP
jgi:hypothetical protein